MPTASAAKIEWANEPIGERYRSLKTLYHQKGWVKLAGLVDEAETRRLRAIVREAVDRPEFKPPEGGAQADQATAEFARVMRVYRALWQCYPEVEQLAHRIGEQIGYLNNWEETRLWQDRLFIKPRAQAGSRETHWHQDVKLPFDRRGFATVWIALVDVPRSRGPLTFLNGSQRLGSLGGIEQLGREYDLSELLSEDDWPLVSGCETAPLKAGDATMHSMLTLHRAGVNMDDEDRVALAISYFDGRQLYTGSPNPVTDNLGLVPGKPLSHDNFPVVAGACS